MTTEETRLKAAKAIIGEAGFWNEGEDLEPLAYDECVFDAGAAEYLIVTDAEADERTAEYCRQTAWAFVPTFLVDYLPDGVGVEVIEALQPKCEGANDAIVSMIGDRFDDFVADAIAADGRGHFLSGYDGEEAETEIDGVTFYGYRVN